MAATTISSAANDWTGWLRHSGLGGREGLEYAITFYLAPASENSHARYFPSTTMALKHFMSSAAHR